jgi:hypothetical protein
MSVELKEISRRPLAKNDIKIFAVFCASLQITYSLGRMDEGVRFIEFPQPVGPISLLRSDWLIATCGAGPYKVVDGRATPAPDTRGFARVRGEA